MMKTVPCRRCGKPITSHAGRQQRCGGENEKGSCRHNHRVELRRLHTRRIQEDGTKRSLYQFQLASMNPKAEKRYNLSPEDERIASNMEALGF